MFAGLYARLIGVALIVAAVLGAWWYVHHLQSEVKELTAAKVVLESKLQDQNNAVEAWKKEADEKLKASEVLVAAANAEAAKAKGRATVIYKTKPSDPNNLCKSALDLVNQGAAK